VAVGVAGVLALNVASWADAAATAETRGEEARAVLLAFLDEHDLDRCYSAAPMYHLVFRSGERTLLVPLQKDRYPEHNREVEESPSVCYVFREDQREKRQHVAMMEHLEREGVAYRSAEVGEYRVLWSFSPRQALSGAVIERIRSPRDPRLLAGRPRGVEEPWT
jgi:hypothetical protein